MLLRLDSTHKNAWGFNNKGKFHQQNWGSTRKNWLQSGFNRIDTVIGWRKQMEDSPQQNWMGQTPGFMGSL